MRALTLTQPWATLMAIGAKRIETRSWSTNYRGTLAIHAAKGCDRGSRDLFTRAPEDDIFVDALLRGGVPHRRFVSPPEHWYYRADPRYTFQLPLGFIVAVVNLIDVVMMVSGPNDDLPVTLGGISGRCNDLLTRQELAFGNYVSGRYGWVTEDVLALREPIPYKGSLGLWNVPPGVRMLISQDSSKRK